MAIIERPISGTNSRGIIERPITPQGNVPSVQPTFQGSVPSQMLYGTLRGLSNAIPGTPFAVNYYSERLKGTPHGQAIAKAQETVKGIEEVRLPSRTARFTELGASVAPMIATMQPFLRGAALIPKIPAALKFGVGMGLHGGASALMRGENPGPAAAVSTALGTVMGPFSNTGSTAGKFLGRAVAGEVGSAVGKRVGSAGASALLSKIVNPEDNEQAVLFGALGGMYPGEGLKAPKFLNKERLATKINQGVIGARKGQFRHGNPPLTMAKENIIFNNLDDGLVKTEAKIQEINADIAQRLEATSQSGTLKNYEFALRPLYVLRKKLEGAPDATREQINQINKIILNLKGYYTTEAGNVGRLTRYPLISATPLDAYKVKQTAHMLADKSYDSPSGGSDVSTALREVNRNLVNMISRRIGELQGIDVRYVKDRLKVEADLIEGKKAIKNSIDKDKVASEADLFRKLRLWGFVTGGGAGFASGGPLGAIVGSVSGAQIERLLISPKFRTRVAAWLVKQPAQRRNSLIESFPQLGQLLQEFNARLGRRGSVVNPLVQGGGAAEQPPFKREELYSKLERVVSSFPQEKFTGQQLLGYLQGKVKIAELENAGLQYIPKDKVVTKTEVLKSIQQATPKIIDVKEGSEFKGYTIPGGDNYRERLAVLDLPAEEVTRKVGLNRYNFSDFPMKEVTPVYYGRRGVLSGQGYQGDYNELKGGLTQSLYSKLEYIGKKNNIIWEKITLVPRQVPKGTSNKVTIEGIDDKGRNYVYFSDPGKLQGPGRRVVYINKTPLPVSSFFEGYEDVAPKLEMKRESSTVRTFKVKPKLFTSGHYSTPNTLFHYRLKDREASFGGKILFIEEIQSDWAKQARKGTAKNYPLLKNWHELAVKKILTLAEKEGYDGVAWTPGQVQSERWRLGNVLKSFEFQKGTTSTYAGWDAARNQPIPGALKYEEWRISGITKDNHNFNKFVPDGQLEDYVGKDIAAIMRKRGKGTLKGKDFPVGPKWPFHLYDEMLPQAIEKYSGGKAEDMLVEAGLSPTHYQEIRSKKVQGVVFTDSIKDNIRKGFELFGIPAGITAASALNDEE